MREIPLKSRKYPGLVALVDDEDYDAAMQYRWYPVKRHCRYGDEFYAYTVAEGKTTYLHNIICQLHGLPKSPDHANRNGLDNQKANLRPASISQNGANQGLKSNNTSGYKGASRDRRSGRWAARIKVNYRNIHLGCYGTAEEAARAYDRAAVEYFGEYAWLNFPPEAEAA